MRDLSVLELSQVMGPLSATSASASALLLQFGFVYFTHDDVYWSVAGSIDRHCGFSGRCVDLPPISLAVLYTERLILWSCLSSVCRLFAFLVSPVCSLWRLYQCLSRILPSWLGAVWNLACLVTFLLTIGTTITLHSSIIAVTSSIGIDPSCFGLLAKTLEFGVCTQLDLLNASVHLSLNKDSSNGMNSRNKDVSDSFFFGSYGDDLVLEDFNISQSLAKFQNNVSVVCLSMILYSWHDLAMLALIIHFNGYCYLILDG